MRLSSIATRKPLRHTLGFTLIVVIAVSILLLTACQTAATNEPSSAEPTNTWVPTPTPIPLGQPGNPIVIAFINDYPGAPVKPEMSELAKAISAQTGLVIEEKTFDTYEALLTSMQAGNVHIAWFHPATYIYAHNKGMADAGLLSNHFGLYFYGSQFLSNIESGYSVYFDPVSNQNAADAATALIQLDNKRPCWIDLKSISGYILPASILKQNGITYQDGVVTQTHTASVRALYIKGICDYAATFALSGDPRTSPGVLSDLTDARERILILWQSDAVIPNLNISFHPDLSPEIRSALNTAFLDLVNTEIGKSVMSAALNYDIQDLRVIDDSIYEPIRAAIQALDINPRDLLGR